MSEVASITQPSLFDDDFYNRAGVLKSYWTVNDGTFSNESETYLQTTSTPAELIYSGTDISTLFRRTISDNINIAIIVWFFGREQLSFEIRGRRSNSQNYYSLITNFEQNTFTLSKTSAGTTTVLDSTEHQFHFDESNKYSIELWMFDNHIYGKINGHIYAYAIDSTHIENSGFSIYIPSINSEDPMIVNNIAVHELIEQESPQLEQDQSNLIVKFRHEMEDVIENPQEYTWETYKKAFSMWIRYKDQWYKNESWKILGYPLSHPNTEKWFND